MVQGISELATLPLQKIKYSIPILAFDEAVPLEYIGGRFLSLDGSLDELGVKFALCLEIRRLLSRDESRDLLMFWAADLPRLVEYPPTPAVRLYVDNSVFNALTRISRLKSIISGTLVGRIIQTSFYQFLFFPNHALVDEFFVVSRSKFF